MINSGIITIWTPQGTPIRIFLSSSDCPGNSEMISISARFNMDTSLLHGEKAQKLSLPSQGTKFWHLKSIYLQNAANSDFMQKHYWCPRCRHMYQFFSRLRSLYSSFIHLNSLSRAKLSKYLVLFVQLCLTTPKRYHLLEYHTRQRFSRFLFTPFHLCSSSWNLIGYTTNVFTSPKILPGSLSEISAAKDCNVGISSFFTMPSTALGPWTGHGVHPVNH